MPTLTVESLKNLKDLVLLLTRSMKHNVHSSIGFRSNMQNQLEKYNLFFYILVGVVPANPGF